MEQAPCHLLDCDTCYLEHDKQKQGRKLKDSVVKVMGCGQVIKTEPGSHWILVFKKTQKSPYQTLRGKVKLWRWLPVAPWSPGPERGEGKWLSLCTRRVPRTAILFQSRFCRPFCLREGLSLGWTQARAATGHLFCAHCLSFKIPNWSAGSLGKVPISCSGLPLGLTCCRYWVCLCELVTACRDVSSCFRRFLGVVSQSSSGCPWDEVCCGRWLSWQ